METGRRAGQAFHCCVKHLGSARVHLWETQQKLIRECPNEDLISKFSDVIGFCNSKRMDLLKKYGNMSEQEFGLQSGCERCIEDIGGEVVESGDNVVDVDALINESRQTYEVHNDLLSELNLNSNSSKGIEEKGNFVIHDKKIGGDFKMAELKFGLKTMGATLFAAAAAKGIALGSEIWAKSRNRSMGTMPSASITKFQNIVDGVAVVILLAGAWGLSLTKFGKSRRIIPFTLGAMGLVLFVDMLLRIIRENADPMSDFYQAPVAMRARAQRAIPRAYSGRRVSQNTGAVAPRAAPAGSAYQQSLRF